MLTTCVSSKLTEFICKQEGFLYAETLTGFKYLGNEARMIEERGEKVIFMYEEAIGFTIGDHVRDKDGISTLGFLALNIISKSQSMADVLCKMYKKFKYFGTCNGYFKIPDAADRSAIFTLLSSLKLSNLSSIHSASSSMITLKFDDLIWMTFRTSGTEPKVKVYSEIEGDYENRVELNEKLRMRVKQICSLVILLPNVETNL